MGYLFVVLKLHGYMHSKNVIHTYLLACVVADSVGIFGEEPKRREDV